MTDETMIHAAVEDLLVRLHLLASMDEDMPEANTPLGIRTREFFENNWFQARDNLLAKTTKLRVKPGTTTAPCSFHFEIDCRYKRKLGSDGLVELVDGTLRGTILYRSDVFVVAREEPSIVVRIDRDQGLLHCNYSRRHAILCIGDIPPGPFPLEALLEHLYGILTYQNCALRDPADLEAARYFASDPEAYRGLENPAPLY